MKNISYFCRLKNENNSMLNINLYKKTNVKSFLNSGIFFLIILSLGFNKTIAQNYNRTGGGTGKVYGIVLDSGDNKAIEYATINLLRASDSTVISGTITDGKGEYKMEDIPFGQYKINISFIGYRSFMTAPFYVSNQNSEVDKGKIRISSGAKKLDEVVITADKNDVQNTLDKRIYNVGKNIVNAGGTATDLLQNIPSVTVDLNGTVSFRGNANVTVLIDGKPSGMTGGDRQALLDQLPGSAIDQIEIVTNPSAKYDAEGMAGIINIITKKDKLKGINGNVSVSGGTHDSYNSTVGLNNRTSKYNLYANFTYRNEMRLFTSHGTQNNYLSDTSYNYLTNTSSYHGGANNNGKLGIDLYLSNYTTLGFYGTISTRNQNEPGMNWYDYTSASGVPFLAYTKQDFNVDKNSTYQGNFDYKHSYPSSKAELNMSGSFSENTRNENTSFINSNYFSELGNNNYQYNYTNAKYITSVFQADYSHPYASKAKFEAGLKGNYRINDNDQHTDTYDFITQNYPNDPLYTNHYKYTEQIYAAYMMYTGTIKFLDYHVGLRTEQTLTSIQQLTTDTTYKNNYLGLFPSASIKYSRGFQEDIQLSYSRRINRPNVWALNPFKDITDSMNIRQGNPFLKPEYIHALELSYNRTIKNFTYTATVYYKHSTNLISYFRIFDTLSGKSILTQENYSTSQNIGVEGSLRYDMGKVGSLMWSFNAYNNKVNAGNLQTDLQSSAINWNMRLTANIRFAKYTAFQLTGYYAAPMTSPQSTVKGFSSVDGGIKQDFWKGKGSLAFNCGDIFNIREMQIHSQTVINGKTVFVYDGARKRESRIAMLTFSWRFGTNNDKPSKKKKPDSNQMEGGDEMMGE